MVGLKFVWRFGIAHDDSMYRAAYNPKQSGGKEESKDKSNAANRLRKRNG
jgi:hypothetical protein